MTKRDECRVWLTTALADGPRIVSEVKQEGTSRGFGKSTIERAAVDLGLSPQRVGSKNYWTLPVSLTQRPEEVEEVAVSGPPPPEDAPEEEHFRWLEANRQAVSNAVRRHRAVLLSVADHLGIQSLVALQRFINRDETLRRIFRETWSRNLDTMLHSAMTKGLKGDRSMQQFFLRGSYNPLEAGPENEEDPEVKITFSVLWPRINAHGGSVTFLMSREDAERLPNTIYVNPHARDAALADIDGRDEEAVEELPGDVGDLLLSLEEQDHQYTVKGGNALNKEPSSA